MGLALTGIITLAKVGLEHTEFGEQLEQMALNLVQVRLGEATRVGGVPIKVVDISALRPVSAEGATVDEQVTPRKELGEIIKAIAAAGPIAIGVDVDFSPTDAGFVTEQDADFLRSLTQLRNGAGVRVRAFVGIGAAARYAARDRLVDPEYADLAACIFIPNPEGRRPVTDMVYELRVKGTSDSCPALATLLAREAVAKHEREAGSSGWPGKRAGRRAGVWVSHSLPWFAEPTKSRDLKELVTEMFPIDTGILGQLTDQRVQVGNAANIAGRSGELHDRLVLVGRGTLGQTKDQFNVSAQPQPVAGVMLHALAVHTLLDAQLFGLTLPGRIVMDSLVAGLLLGLVALVQALLLKRRSAWNPRWDGIFVAVVWIGAYYLGYVAVERIGLLWTDFLAVMLATLLHWGVVLVIEARAHGAEHS